MTSEPFDLRLGLATYRLTPPRDWTVGRLGQALGLAPLGFLALTLEAGAPVSEDTPLAGLPGLEIRPLRGGFPPELLDLLPALGCADHSPSIPQADRRPRPLHETSAPPTPAAPSCRYCGQPAALTSTLALRPGDVAVERVCGDCLERDLTRRVGNTLAWYELLSPRERVLVSLSGGKDSAVTLLLLTRLLGERAPERQVEAVFVDEGVPGYSDDNAEACENLCRRLGVKLHRIALAEAAGADLPALVARARLHPGRVCNHCGGLKGRIVVDFAVERGFNVLARGETHTDLLRWVLLGRLRGRVSQHFVPRRPLSGVALISPLMAVDDIETATLVATLGLPVGKGACPYGDAPGSTRATEEQALRLLTSVAPGTSATMLGAALPGRRGEQAQSCLECGLRAGGLEGGAESFCAACRIGASEAADAPLLAAHPMLRLYFRGPGGAVGAAGAVGAGGAGGPGGPGGAVGAAGVSAVVCDPYDGGLRQIPERTAGLLGAIDGRTGFADPLVRTLLREGWVRIVGRRRERE